MSERIDRQRLYELVWSAPISKLADQFGYSGPGLAKICRRYGIPLPSRGYWAKVRAGHKVKKAPLPVPERHQQSLALSPLSEPERLIRSEHRQRLDEVRSLVAVEAVPGEQEALHPLAKAARARLKQRDWWGDPDLRRSAPSEVLDIRVTKASIDRATEIASVLVRALERIGGAVAVDTDRGRTVLSLAGAELGLQITEHIARSNHEPTPAETKALERYRNDRRGGPYSTPYPNIPQYDYTPTGALTISATGWPSRNWRDAKTRQLEQRMDAVVAGIAALAEEVSFRERERIRKQQEHERKVRAYEEAMAQRAQEQAAFGRLLGDANKHGAAQGIRSYIRAVEESVARCGLGSSFSAAWIAWAKQQADRLDPLCHVSNVILDAPEPEKPGSWWS